ncbi:arabinan endo-1,5-alpha-L-arabinosidase [Cyclobacterium lianum]|uniref:Arabinan endo-1,5-alpha-L-arabinosidase n=1 Tax=Cyclobacterium lianum TaxID=388280 RepID=A0A1M7QVH1_9BACT|nr:arabinan endo-1,5-alpha-L-arabinosidase [Cyclobacterium lianum]SHN35851.1 arabinan endo-1,5-alpha-L-arabinosidase [Cyclobacterium lianum]
MKYFFAITLFLACNLNVMAQQVDASPDKNGHFEVGDITTDPGVRDPTMAKEGGTYYIYFTGGGIQVWSSKDMKTWKKEPSVFSEAPEWVAERLPSFKGLGFWAPDLSYHEGQWYLYYATSIFGKNTSVIGMATNKTLNPLSEDYKWEDRGLVMQSVTGRDHWNAIDPNLTVDEQGTPWLTFGSHWNGLKMVKLSKDFKTPAEPQEWHTIAARPRDFKYTDEEVGNGAVEAPFIFKKDDYYYLFVSWDRCCAGPNSTYNIRVGRAENITGPYLDKDGVDLAKNGGTFVLGGDTGPDSTVYARGHNAAYTFDGIDYLVFHAYTDGYERLGIEKISWVDGWPTVKQ